MQDLKFKFGRFIYLRYKGGAECDAPFTVEAGDGILYARTGPPSEFESEVRDGLISKIKALIAKLGPVVNEDPRFVTKLPLDHIPDYEKRWW